MRYRDFKLYPFQEEAIGAISQGRSVLVAAPTGAGKTLIAEYAVEHALERGQRIVYTSPIKALSNQKYRDFTRTYRDRIGIMTGDVTINPEAPVQIMTTEIFRNTIFENPARLSDISYVILDEVHYLSDPDRGTVWEESIIFAPEGIRFLGLSATISNLQQFRDWVARVREEEVDLISTEQRPVPLKHLLWVPELGELRVGELRRSIPAAFKERRKGRRGRRLDIVRHLSANDMLPALFFCFSRKECEGRAARTRVRLLDDRGRGRILQAFDQLSRRFRVHDHPATLELRKLAGRGVLYHHAGMMPLYKEVVERLFTTGMIKLLYTTETFALGVNMPARTVVFSALRKFDGVGFSYMQTLSYYQMAGRAGRQGLDTEGTVYSLADVEEDEPKAVKRVIFGRVEPLRSRFNLAYSAILNLYEHLGEDIHSAVDRSFAVFQRGGHSAREHSLLDSRLGVLRSMGYLEGRSLTGKGRFASRINGYEIHVTELFWSGCFEGLDPVDCAVLVTAVVYEARRMDESVTWEPGALRSLLNRARRQVRAFRRAETRQGIDSPVKELDWSLSAAVRAWAEGCPFEELHAYTGCQEGDVVRAFRMSIQVLRQFATAAREDRELAERLWHAFRLINRDEVDAELQIRLGQD